MAVVDSISPLLGMTLMGDGLDFNTWGDTANANFTTIENAIAGVSVIPIIGPTQTLTIAQASAAILAFTGALTSNSLVTLPPVSRKFIVSNQTTGPFTLSLQAGANVPVVIPAASNQTNIYWTDGQNIFNASTSVAAVTAAIAAYLPPGVMLPFSGQVAPSGWLFTNGAAYLISTYPALAAVLGTTGTDGVSWNQTAPPPTGSFHVPDIRGVGIRGWDNGKGLDPGRAFASYQPDMFASHTHVQNPHAHGTTEAGHSHSYGSIVTSNSFGAGGSTAVNSSTPASTGATATGLSINNATAVNQNTGSTETVGKNIAAPFIIRT
jgi:microcystin-dependent protein